MALERTLGNIKDGARNIADFINKEDGMFILTRKIDQGIVIAGNIIVRVLGVEKDRVKIGISAPREVPVLRQELLERGNKEEVIEIPLEPESSNQGSQ